MLTKSFGQNVSDLILKILLLLVIEKLFMCYLQFEFFFCSRKTAMIGFERNKWLAKEISKPMIICIMTIDGIRWNTWQNTTNIYYLKRKQATNIQIFAVSEVSGRNRNPNSGTETFSMVTCDDFKQSKNSVLCLFAANYKLFWITYCRYNGNNAAPKSF